MKPSREQDMALCVPGPAGSCSALDEQQVAGVHAYTGGLLALVPQQGLVFAPLDLDGDPGAQAPFQVLLHKGSDELQYGEGGAPAFSARMARLQRWLEAHPGVRVVDPFIATAKVINRLELCTATQQLADIPPISHQLGEGQPDVLLRMCAPRYCVLHSADEAQLAAAVDAAGLRPPWVLKPCVACGLPDSHRMALVLHPRALGPALAAAGVRLPAVLQEFGAHGGKVVKAYVAGGRVFHSVRPSIPDLPAAGAGAGPPAGAELGSTAGEASTVWQQAHQQGFLAFDSLKSLPVSAAGAGAAAPASEGVCPGGGWQADVEQLVRAHPEALQAIASKLHAALGLSLFGFDVIAVPCMAAAQHRVVELQVIDVNYFPSFKVKGAADHVWATIKGDRA